MRLMAWQRWGGDITRASPSHKKHFAGPILDIATCPVTVGV
jgi:hypothetical protein